MNFFADLCLAFKSLRLWKEVGFYSCVYVVFSQKGVRVGIRNMSSLQYGVHPAVQGIFRSQSDGVV